MKRFLPKIKLNSFGFTLIELMVVITIIAILGTIGIVVFSSAQKNARDGKRRADIDAIATAIEQAKAPASSTYSVLATSNFAGSAVPDDTTTAKYCIKTSVTAGDTGASIPDPTAWATTSACPTAAATWSSFSSEYSAASGTNALGLAVAWKVCALLENGTNPTVYCKASSQ